MVLRHIKHQVVRYGVCSSWLRHLNGLLDAICRRVLSPRSLLLRIQHERKSVCRGVSRFWLYSDGCRCDLGLPYIRIHPTASRSPVDVALLVPLVDQVTLAAAVVPDNETHQDEQEDDGVKSIIEDGLPG
jgi:hypothetical protein